MRFQGLVGLVLGVVAAPALAKKSLPPIVNELDRHKGAYNWGLSRELTKFPSGYAYLSNDYRAALNRLWLQRLEGQKISENRLDLGQSATMNCWECLLNAGHQAGAIPLDWLFDLHIRMFGGQGQALHKVLLPSLGYGHAVKTKVGAVWKPGALVVLGGGTHIVLASEKWHPRTGTLVYSLGISPSEHLVLAPVSSVFGSGGAGRPMDVKIVNDWIGLSAP